MRGRIISKFIAIVMAVVSIVTVVGCSAGIVALESAELYIRGLDTLQNQAYDSIAKSIIRSYTDLFAVENLGDIPYTLKESLYNDPLDRSDSEHWHIRLECNGEILAQDGVNTGTHAYEKQMHLAPLYVIASRYSPEDMEATKPPETTTPTNPSDPTAPTTPQKPPETEKVYPEITVPEDYLYYRQEVSLQGGSLTTYYLYYYQAPRYTVTVYLREEVLESSSLYLLDTIYPHRFSFIGMLIFGLLMLAISLVYLIDSAGRHPDGTIHPGGLNRLPIDLYAIIVAIGIYFLSLLFSQVLDWVNSEGPHYGNITLLGVNLTGIAILGIAFLFALSAQLKMSDHYIWRHSAIGWLVQRIIDLFRLLGRGISALAQVFPLISQWLLTVFGLLAISIVFLVLAVSYQNTLFGGFFTVLLTVSLLGFLGVLLYGGYCNAVLMKGVRQMRDGDLRTKVPTRHLRGSFLTFAEDLNALSETAYNAAQQQMRSERMKSELITNVSHDIKTPLTSIINFVDLLQKPHSPQQEQEYLEVLARQSSQMKKLIQDLVELSKVSSGNITVNPQMLDAAETVNQALGEFSDKLEAAGLTPMFQHPEESLQIYADGRLVWRVLFNLLTNAIKYAMPGTRLYLDLFQAENAVVLSIKNVSRAPLNVAAEDLLERFVRGDSSRKSDGSGLGLNIAKSLMESQGGQLQLMLDGDLFKVTLVFPAAPAELPSEEM